MPAIRKNFGTRKVKKPSSTKVRPSGKHVRPDWFGHEARRLQNISDLQSKFPNISRDIIVDSMKYGKGKNPDQFQKSLINSIKREKILRGAGKGAKFVAGKSVLPIAALQFLQGSPAGADSDVVPELTLAERKKEKQYFDEWNKKIASQYHASEYADAFPQDKKRGGKVKKKKKKKKSKSKTKKIMYGYKAGGKV